MKNLNLYINEALVNHKVKSKNFIDYVDLGLPSGTLWATCNVGADKPEDPGLLFQWGIPEGYDKYHLENFIDDEEWSTLFDKKYEKGQFLKNEDDPAYILSNGTMKIPSTDDFEELIDNTKFKRKENGFEFISKNNDNKLFIPNNEMYYGKSKTMSGTTYSIDLLINKKSEYKSIFIFDCGSNAPMITDNWGRNGYPIRPVFIN